MKNNLPFERGDWVAANLLNSAGGLFYGRIIGTSEGRGIRLQVHAVTKSSGGGEWNLAPCINEDFVFPWTSIAYLHILTRGRPQWCKCSDDS